MPKRISMTSLNASTIDILNTIRANASAEYQSLVPNITNVHDIPKVGEILYGYPALANQFLTSLINRIALVRVKSATFNNAYAELKKGYLEFGETVEEVFVNICKAREFSAEKAESREFKRSIPDVRTALHAMNYRVQYPITIQDEDLRMAFTSASGVQDLIAKIVDAVYTSAEYDEYLLFKWAMIKAITSGKMYPVAVDASDMKNSAKSFRGVSNMMTFMSTKYNNAGVHNTTPKGDQYIFMDAMFDASYDVDVLSSAFNMDKATYEGHRKLIDDWTTFDNDRFSVIMDGSDMIDPVTPDELALMQNVIGVLVDKEWFQFYDNQNKMTEKYVASGEYWNYFYNVWKTVSTSPFSNAVVFVKNTADVDLPASIDFVVDSIVKGETATIVTLREDVEADPTLAHTEIIFDQNATNTTNGVAVHKYGAYIIPNGVTNIEIDAYLDGVYYTPTVPTITVANLAVGATITLNNSEVRV